MTLYKPIQVFILNKHVVRKDPHRLFDLNTTNMLYFKSLSNIDYYFVFDIEDKRETYADTLNQIINQSLIPLSAYFKVPLK